MKQKLLILFILVFYAINIKAQAPSNIPYGESEPLTLTTTNIIIYIIIPVLIVVAVIFIRRRNKINIKKNSESKSD